MFSVPLSAFLIAYLIFLIIFLLFSFANVYHLVSTGTFTAPAIAITIIVSAWCIGILFFTWFVLNDINWGGQAVFFGNNEFIEFGT